MEKEETNNEKIFSGNVILNILKFLKLGNLNKLDDIKNERLKFELYYERWEKVVPYCKNLDIKTVIKNYFSDDIYQKFLLNESKDLYKEKFFKNFTKDEFGNQKFSSDTLHVYFSLFDVFEKILDEYEFQRLLAIIFKSSSIKHIKMDRPINDTFITISFFSNALERLETIVFANTSITDHTIFLLASQKMKNLKSISMWKNKVTSNGIKAILNSPAFEDLEYLRMNVIYEDGMEIITEEDLFKIKSLRTISIPFKVMFPHINIKEFGIINIYEQINQFNFKYDKRLQIDLPFVYENMEGKTISEY